jgi:hypothetical protein
LALASFVTSDHSVWIVWALFLVGGTAFLLALAAFAIWFVGNQRQRKLEERQGRWEPLLLDYLCLENEADSAKIVSDLSALLRPRDRQDFGEFVTEYLEKLRGLDAERLCQLLRELGYVERATQQLRSRNQWTRASAARLLGELNATSSIDQLAEALRDRSHAVSYSAALALLRIGSEKCRVLVAGALGVREDWSMGQIKELVSDGGTALAEHLHQILKHQILEESRIEILVEIMGILRHIPAGEILLELLRAKPSRELRISLFRSLGRLGVPEAVPFALEGLGDPDWVVRSQSALALGRIGDVGAVLGLARALHDSSYWVRYNAAIALRELGTAGRSVLERTAATEGPVAILAQEITQDAA